jgi:hypothetical protein
MQIYPDYPLQKSNKSIDILKNDFTEDILSKLPFYFVAHWSAPLYFVVIIFGPEDNYPDKQ